MNHNLPVHVTGLAMALLAGFLFVVPAQAQSSNYDSTYSSSRGVDDDSTYPSGSVDDNATPNDDDDTADDDAQAAYDSERGDDDRTVDDGQDFARSEEETRCLKEFQSFDPATGMYVTEEGDRERCPYLF